MSDANVSNESHDESGASGANQDSNGGMVKFESYSKVLGQKKAADARTRELEAELAEFRAKQKAEEEEKLHKEKRFEELAARLKEEKTAAEQRLATIQSEMVNSIKRQTVEQQLGGFARPEYAQFMNLAAIELDESGRPDAKSVQAEVARIRTEHPHLLKPSTQNPPSGKPPTAFDDSKKPSAEDAYRDEINKLFGEQIL